MFFRANSSSARIIRRQAILRSIALSISSTPGVTIMPGLTVLDVMPVPANSLARLTARLALAFLWPHRPAASVNGVVGRCAGQRNKHDPNRGLSFPAPGG